MKSLQINRLSLHLHLGLMRFGWSNGIACIICVVGATGWLWGEPYLRTKTEALQKQLARVGKSTEAADAPAIATPRPLAEERLIAFYDALGEKPYAEQQVKTLFAIATKTNLTLNQAEYKPAFDKNGRYHTYQINLPVKGSYKSIRQFCEQTLLTIPFASLDEINFKRDAIASAVPEAKLRFTLYLGEASPEQKIALGMQDGMQ